VFFPGLLKTSGTPITVDNRDVYTLPQPLDALGADSSFFTPLMNDLTSPFFPFLDNLKHGVKGRAVNPYSVHRLVPVNESLRAFLFASRSDIVVHSLLKEPLRYP
jgi:hypothetical protein